jgi:hypothetical protein
MGAIRFTASEWNKMRGQHIPIILFALAMGHLERTEKAPLVTASGRSEIGCWACERIIERGETYRAESGDRRLKMGVHQECLEKVREWADYQEKRNRDRANSRKAG